MGQIRRRGGVYWIRYYDTNGQRHEESARTDKFEQARSLLRQREGDVEKGLPVSARIGRLCLADAAKQLVTDYRINGRHSLDDVERHVARLTGWFGSKRRLASITSADISAYVEQRQSQEAANATINRELAALRRMFRLAVGKFASRPEIKLLRENNTRQGFFEKDQIAAVLRHLSPPLQAVLTFAFYTGWRKTEILTLEWSRVDRQAGIVRLDPGQTKNGEAREFTFREVVDVQAMFDRQWAEHLRLKKAGRIVPLVFHRDGKPITSFRKALARACEAAGCPGRLLHDCRRSAVRNLVRAGVPDVVVQRLTGHRTRSVFDRYNITSEADRAEAGRRLQAFTGTISGTIEGSDEEAELLSPARRSL